MDRQDHRHFGRLAVMLLALAVLAERAGGACLPVRCLVLWILRRAEAAARAHAIETAGSPLLVACLQVDDTQDEAARLAAKLRALAAVFRLLAHRTKLAPRAAPRRQRLLLLHLSVASVLAAALPARRLDTS